MFQQVADFPAWRKPVHPARGRRTHQLSQATGHHIRPQKRTDGIVRLSLASTMMTDVICFVLIDVMCFVFRVIIGIKIFEENSPSSTGCMMYTNCITIFRVLSRSYQIFVVIH